MNAVDAARHRAAWLAAVVAVLAMGLGTASQAAPRTLKLAIADVPYAAAALIAEAEGFFGAEGLDLQIQHCVVGRVCMQKLLDGEVQFATVADTPVAVAAFSGKPFAVVATTARSGDEVRMVARADRGIRGPADLKGKRIGLVPGTTGHYFTETFLLFHGIARADVTLIPIESQKIAQALLRGDIDAAGLFEPNASDAVRRLGRQAVVLPAPAFFTLYFNMVATRSPVPAVGDDDVVRLLRALERANTLIHGDPVRAQAILAKTLKLDPPTIVQMWPNFAFVLDLAQPLVLSLEAQTRWALRDGLVPAGSRLPDVLDTIWPEPLQRVAPRAVRIVK